MSLKIDFCSYKAATYAVMNWHYSRTMPAGKLFKIGVWENEKFIGAVIFGRGAGPNVAKSFGLPQTECVELVRVALTNHIAPVTQIVSIALKILHKQNPGLKLILSYADKTNQDHYGIIYQAGNWLYLSERVQKQGHYFIGGRVVHSKTINGKYGCAKNIPPEIKKLRTPPQHKFLYAYAFDKAIKKDLESKALPYPKRDKQAMAGSSSTAAVQHRPSRSKSKKVGA